MSISRTLATFLVPIALVITPTAATASGATGAQAFEPPSSWMALSMLTPSGTVGLGGTAVAAVQPEAPPPPPQSSQIGMPPWPVIGIWVAVLAVDIYILTLNHHHHAIPNSPA